MEKSHLGTIYESENSCEYTNTLPTHRMMKLHKMIVDFNFIIEHYSIAFIILFTIILYALRFNCLGHIIRIITYLIIVRTIADKKTRPATNTKK